MSTTELAPGAVFTSIPAEDAGGWIAPWLEDIVKSVQAGQSPFLFILDITQHVYYPVVGNVFRVQLWILVALFGFTIGTILLASVLRYSQGRTKLFVRLDRTVILPSSGLFPICALVHAALGIAIVAGARKIANLEPYPHWFQGMKACWVAPLFTGIYFEVWGCFSAWYIRRYGPQYRESWTRTTIAVAIPILLVLAVWVPSIWFFLTASIHFNASLRVAEDIKILLKGWQQEWILGDRDETEKISQLFRPGGDLGRHLQLYSERSSCGSRWITIVLMITLTVYLVGAILELVHLTSTIHRLRATSEVIQLAASERRSEATNKARHASEPGFGFAEEKTEDDCSSLRERELKQCQLMEWTRTNRSLTTLCICVMLLQNAGFALWRGLTPLTLATPSTQFQADILISGWMNSILSTFVALLILLRSLDGSSPLVLHLKSTMPLLPFPPPLDTVSLTSVPLRRKVLVSTAEPRLEGLVHGRLHFSTLGSLTSGKDKEHSALGKSGRTSAETSSSSKVGLKP